jgi:pentatricopeptide repeat protein
MGFSFSVLGRFFKFGFEPNVRTFNTLINGFVREGRVTEAAGLFSKMVDTGCKPDVFTFNTLTKGLCIKGNNSGALQLLRKMEQSGDCKPDLVAYNTIIDSLCKDTLVVDAFNLFSEMITKGIAPDVITYNSLILG